ncbi:hypothetical protein [Lentzea jiangxiensis]|uniref:hypothetical protein n=1 Tax=Lentzea jiangxiensis TaxID=641025 RepID=UPI00115F8A8A|nr:hypothetical protein [Lentzea jiangxiensis]
MIITTVRLSAVLGAAVIAGMLGSTQANAAAAEQVSEPTVRALGPECGTDSMKWGSTPAVLN